jgi:carboxyl-terminal processing protease
MRHAPRTRFSCVALTLWLLTTGAGAQDKDGAPAPPPPLFDTDIGFEFDNAQRTFDEVRGLLLEHYSSAELSEQTLYWAAVNGMLRHVSPPSSPEQARVWTPTQYQRVLAGLKGQQTSIGIHSQFNERDASLTVTAVTLGSPADGTLAVNDRIMRINGAPLTGLTAERLDALLRPARGSVALTVVRDIEVFEVELEPSAHEESMLHGELLADEVAYLRINRITAGIAEAASERLQAWRERGVRRLIIDLRNNGGGVFIEGLRLAELFVPKDAVLLITLRAGETRKTFVSSNDAPFDMRTVLLVNEGTASAAEVIAAALVSNGRGRMLGEKSYGKATVEQTFTLANDMRLRFIVGAMYAPGGASWNERGLRPEVEVRASAASVKRWLTLPAAARLDRDVQLRSAWQMLR